MRKMIAFFSKILVILSVGRAIIWVCFVLIKATQYVYDEQYQVESISFSSISLLTSIDSLAEHDDQESV
jgi:hypothetical protein